jgi:hypothetical protein
MADLKISELVAIGTLAAEDLFAVVDDPSGTPATRKATLTQLLTFMDNNVTVTESQISDLGTTAAMVADNLSVFASTTKAQLEGILSDVSNIAEADGDVYTGTHDFGGADDFEVPNSATPIVDTDGQIALDTTVTDFSHGILKYFGGEEVGVIGMPIAQFTTPTDGYVIAYNATNDEFELVAQSGGASDLNGLSDVTITGGANKHALMHNGAGQYVNRVLVEADLSDLGTAIALVADNLSVFASTTKAQLEGVLSDVSNIAEADGDVYTGTHDFGGADDLEIPNSATPVVDTDGQVAIDTTVTDFSTGILKYYGGEEMAVVAMPIAQLTSPTNAHVVSYNATNDEFELVAAAGGGGDLTQYPIPCVMEIPEGAIAYPEIHTLATAVAKVSGFVMPDGASASTINFKCVCPTNLAGTPAMKIRVRIMTMGAVAGPADVRLTVKTVGIADTESLDTAFTAETETTVTMPTATETMDYYTQDLTTDWVAGDTIIGQIARDPTDAADDFTDDILIVGIDLLVDLTPA